MCCGPHPPLVNGVDGAASMGPPNGVTGAHAGAKGLRICGSPAIAHGALAPNGDGAPGSTHGGAHTPKGDCCCGAEEPWWPFNILAAAILFALGTREFSLCKNFLARCRARLSFRCQAGEEQEGQGVIVENVLRLKGWGCCPLRTFEPS